jgi:hypothetical protein
MHPATLVGIALDALAVAGGWTCAPWLGAVMAAAWGLTVIGALCVARGRHVMGRRLVLVGSVAFVPIGLIAAWGVTTTIDQANARAFRERRGDP